MGSIAALRICTKQRLAAGPSLPLISSRSQPFLMMLLMMKLFEVFCASFATTKKITFLKRAKCLLINLLQNTVVQVIVSKWFSQFLWPSGTPCTTKTKTHELCFFFDKHQNKNVTRRSTAASEQHRVTTRVCNEPHTGAIYSAAGWHTDLEKQLSQIACTTKQG